MSADRSGVRPQPGKAGQGSQCQADQGLTADSCVASDTGWRRVGDLSVGDRIVTFDNGLQDIIAFKRSVLWPGALTIPAAFWPLTVPAGKLCGENEGEITLLPAQGVLVESSLVRDSMGDPFAVVPSIALEGLCGIRRRAPSPALEQIQLVFSHEEVIYLRGGMLVFCRGRTAQDVGGDTAAGLYNFMSEAVAGEVFSLDRTLAEKALVRTGRYTAGYPHYCMAV